MARKPKPTGTNQMTFQFTLDVKDLVSLDGGSQDALSDFEFRFRQLLKTVLDDCGKRDKEPLDRLEVAVRMSRKLGREITKSQIDQWTAMVTVQRRMHVDALKAMCEVTGDNRLLHFYVESCGFKALSPDEAVCAEYGAQMMMKRKLEYQMKETLSGVDADLVYAALMKRMIGGEE